MRTFGFALLGLTMIGNAMGQTSCAGYTCPSHQILDTNAAYTANDDPTTICCLNSCNDYTSFNGCPAGGVPNTGVTFSDNDWANVNDICCFLQCADYTGCPSHQILDTNAAYTANDDPTTICCLNSCNDYTSFNGCPAGKTAVVDETFTDNDWANVNNICCTSTSSGTGALGDPCSAPGDCASNDCNNGVCVCIEVGQRVLMDDGTHKNIEHLQPGDILRTPTGRTTVRSTRRGGRHLSAVHDVSCNGMTGSITGNHAYHCDGEWRLPQETHKPRALTGTTEVVAVETDNYCEDRMILESGLHVETWDGRGIGEWRPHTFENGRRLRCTLKGTWRDRVLQRVDSKQ